MDKVIWTIECDEISFCQHVQARSNEEMVKALVSNGFQRMLKPDVPFQDEPLVFEDEYGRVWDAMPAVFPWAHMMRDMAGFTKEYNGRRVSAGDGSGRSPEPATCDEPGCSTALAREDNGAKPGAHSSRRASGGLNAEHQARCKASHECSCSALNGGAK